MVRMLEAGEDPVFVLRRMVIFAAEDIGNADPQALVVANAALDAVRLVGLPEGVLPMSQAATYLATAPKSNSALTGYTRARRDVLDHGPLSVPLKLRNAPTRLMKEHGYGESYRYPHNFDGHYVPESYLPKKLERREYYTPSTSGHEAEIARRLEQWREQRDGGGGRGSEGEGGQNT
jgi:putative ATPase